MYIAAVPNAMSPTLSMKPPMMALVENNEEEDEAAADCVLLVVGEVVALVGAAGSERVGRRGWIPDRCWFSPHGAQ